MDGRRVSGRELERADIDAGCFERLTSDAAIDVPCFHRHRAGVVLMTAGNPFDVGCFDRQYRRSSLDVARFDCQHE
jgi:hypothetical protein